MNAGLEELTSDTDLLLVCALAIERNVVWRSMTDVTKLPCEHGQLWRGNWQGHKVLLLQTGPGSQAETALRKLLDQFKVTNLLVFGLAGSLTERFPVGCVVRISEVRTVDQPGLESVEVCSTPEAFVKLTELPAARLITVMFPIVSATEKQKLHQSTGVDMVDMESAYLVQQARKSGISHAVIRAVSDGVHQSLPAECGDWIDCRGEFCWKSFALSLLKRPSIIFSLWRLWRGSRAGLSSLQKFL